MTKRLCVAIMVGLAAAFSNFAQAQEFSSLEERMTGEEFRAAGLEKLSPDELAALNEWIRAHSLATLDEARELRDRPGELPPIDRMAREPFRTRIKGPFSGWNKDTEFVLENGMVWVPTEDRNFYMPETDSPYVIIRPGALGTWLLNVEGYNQSVRVKRIK